MADYSDFELRTLPGLWRLYEQMPRQLAFQAKDREQAETWQSELRATLAPLLGGFPSDRCDLDPHQIDAFPDESFTRELFVIQTQPGEYLPCHILIPWEVKPPYQPVIALHGHGSWGARALAEPIYDPAEAESVRALNYDYGRQLAKHGFMVFVPELRGFGNRLEDPPLRENDNPGREAMWASSCRAVAVNALLLGKTLLGMRVWDVIRLVDYIRSRPEPMTTSLGCVGLSGGGTVTLFTTALESRITCAVVSGYFNTFRHSIMAIDHCLCNYIPGILQYCEMVDIAGLIAPRPLLVEAGDRDPIFPVTATRQALAELRRIYACFEAADRLEADLFAGEHRWSGAKACDWLKRSCQRSFSAPDSPSPG